MQQITPDFWQKSYFHRFMAHYLARKYGSDFTRRSDKIQPSLAKTINIFAFCCNLFLFISKLIFALLTSSIAIMVDAFNNLSDFIATIIAFVGMQLANLPPDKEHPHGHAILERITALLVGLLVLLIGFSFLRASVLRLMHPEEVLFNPLTFVILFIGIIVKLIMHIVYKINGEFLQSQTFKANSIDTIGDVYITSCTLLSYIFSPFTNFPVDAIAALFLACLVIKNAIGLLKETISILLGQGIDKETEKELYNLLRQLPEIKSWHDLRYHEYGNVKVASIDLEVPYNMTIAELHPKIDAVEQEILEKLQIKLYTHLEPQSKSGDYCCQDKRLICLINSALQQTQSNSRLHDFELNHEKKLLRFDIEYYVDDPNTHFDQDKCREKFLRNFKRALEDANLDTFYASYDWVIGIFPNFNHISR